MAEENKVKEQPKKKVNMNDAIAQCSTLLVQVPDAMDFKVQRTETGRHYYAFDNVTPQASDVRDQIRSILKEVYDSGAYSYGMFATKLRVDGLSIQAILDDEFIEQNNLNG